MPQSRREYKSPGFTISSPALHYILSGFTIFVSNIEKTNVLDARNSWQGDTTKNSKSTSDLSFVSHISLICAFPVLITASFLLLHTFVNNFVRALHYRLPANTTNFLPNLQLQVKSKTSCTHKEQTVWAASNTFTCARKQHRWKAQLL